uniref:Kelch-like protein 17 n=1 Tax=Rhizophagus irregularis (strain DAOM 181602 / DAOM 197198 / MUCL 43194) TaxID=747089 RepID=U9USS2_RHIID
MLKDEKYCDVTIEVGNNPYVKIFRAHMIILCYRSSYLQKILLTNKKKNDDETLSHSIKLPDILPEIFQIILKYIYSGIISLDEYEPSVIIKILIAANKLCLKELIIFLQCFLIEKRSDWMELNPSYIYRLSFENNSFTELQKYCDYLISKDPDKIFKSLDLSSTPEKLLVKLIQNDKLQMSKIQVWEYALKWGHAQNPELPSDLKNFSKKDFKTLKNSLQRCIQLIKFYNLTLEEFSDKILPYKKIFPKELYEDLSKYFSNLDKKSIKEPEPYVIKDVKEDCLKNIDSKIITFQHAELILKWINTNNSSMFTSIFSKWIYNTEDTNTTMNINTDMNTNINASTNTNMFKLLLRGTRDGFTPEKFHKICNNKSHTVTIIKVKGSNEILGGYNPNTWKSNDMYDDTKDSFIFSFKNNLDIENHILSRIKIDQLATYNGIDMGPSFSGSDLTLSNNVGRSIKITYERPIREITDDFLVEEYEANRHPDHTFFII